VDDPFAMNFWYSYYSKKMSSLGDKIAIIYECLDTDTKKRIDAKIEELDRKYRIQEEESLKKLKDTTKLFFRSFPLLFVIFGLFAYFYGVLDVFYTTMIPMLCASGIIIYFSLK
jgi:hypothetical protein